jgi:hypothetical protein
MAAQENNGGRRGNPKLTAAWTAATALLLLTPLVAMQFTDEVNWTVSDFVFAGGLLVGSGIIYELAARAGNLAYQAAVVVALGAVVLIMWTTGAVGVIGSEANPGNLLYVGVAGLAILGSIVAGGRAAAMRWAMSVAAVATLLVPVIAYAGVANPRSDVLAPEVFIATGVFTAMWLLSARLFHESILRRSLAAQNPSKLA